MQHRGPRPLMVTVLRLLATVGAAAGLAVGLAGCGAAAPDVPMAVPQAAPSSAPVEYEAPPGDAADVETTFREYNRALLARDFPTACRLTSTAAVRTLVAAVKKQGGRATGCEQAFRSLYAVQAASAGADAVSRAIRITGVRVSDGTGLVDWTVDGTDGGAPRSSTAGFRKVGDTWKLQPPSS